MERKHYIDNLRLMCILLLIPYHAAMAWNVWGEGNYILLGQSRILSSLVVGVSPWYMTLLFLLAGISARYSLQRRSYGKFAKERVLKLLLPLLIGTVTVMPILCFIADRTNCGYQGSFWEHYPVFFTKWTDITGYDGGFSIGHLWFLLYLFVISMVSLPIISLQGKQLKNAAFQNVNATVVLIFTLLALALSRVELGGKSILTYLLLYLLGYFVLSEETVIDRLQRGRYLYLILWIVFSVVNVYCFLWSERDYGIVNQAMSYGAGCFGIMTLLSVGKNVLNRTHRMGQFLSAQSFLIYIFHFPWVVALQYVLSTVTSNTALIFGVSTVCAFSATILTSTLVKNIPVVNVLFGVKKRNLKREAS